MHDLEQLERWMQAVLMHPGGVAAGVASARPLIDVAPEEVEQVVTRSRALGGLERLEIYNRAYYARLVECLREEFRVLVHALGEETFDQFAIDYLQQYPSRSYTLNQLGVNFPHYLAESRPPTPAARGKPGKRSSSTKASASWPDFLIDLATLELTYSQVFDGPGVEGQRLLDVDQLLAISPQRWPEARLVPVNCLRLLTLRYPVHRYFSAVRRNQDPAFPGPRATRLAVTRRDYVVRRYELSRQQYVLLEALVAGQAVAEAIGRVAATGPDPERLAGQLRHWFRNWTAEGFFQAVELPR